MVKCLKELKYAAICAIRVIGYAISGNKTNAEKFVAVGGLKYVFPMLVGRGLPKILVNGKKKSRSAVELQETEEDLLSILGQLCLLLHDSTEFDSSTRLLAKFLESDFEKLDHCVELFSKYSKQLQATEYQLEAVQLAALRAQMEEAGVVDEDEDDRNEAQEFRYTKRLEGGLLALQQIAVMLAFAGTYGGKEVLIRVGDRLRLDRMSLEDVQNVLREAASFLLDKTALQDPGLVPGSFGLGHHTTLIAWSATIGELKKELL